MKDAPVTEDKQANYQVKNIEQVMVGSDMRARLFTLAPGETIPWHYHRGAADHYFVLEGELVVLTRATNEATHTVGIGSDYPIEPGTPHQISNRSTKNCRFLLLQGVGKYDWVKVAD